MAPPPPAGALRVCVVGAESTGKTTLVAALAQALRERGHPVATVGEALRDWCAIRQRLPAPQEQAAIAQAQVDAEHRAAASLAAAPGGPRPVLVADTAPLVVATYSDWLFADASMLPGAVAHHRGYAATLLTGLDTPWVPDGLQRDGPAAREVFDARLREQLAASGLPWQVVLGSGPQRLAHALRALDGVLQLHAQDAHPPEAEQAQPAWHCAECADPACEHRLFRRLLDRA